jgi:hypothetical protein
MGSFALPDAVFAESVAAIGRTGSGKTTACRGQVEKMLARGERVCIIDPSGAWWGLKSSADGASPGFGVAIMGGDHADVQITEASGPALADVIAANNLPAIIDVSEMGMGARVRFMTGFLEQLYAKNKQPLTLVIDECDLFAPQRPMPDQTKLLNRMEQIVRRGRIRGFRPWMITQRPAELHKSVLSQASTLIAMKLTAPQDRNALGAWIDGQGDREQAKEILATLPKLQPGEGFVWCPAIDYLHRVKFPKIRTFDSGRTPTTGETVTEPTTLAQVDISGVLAALEVVEPAPKGGKAAAPVVQGYSQAEMDAAVEAGASEAYARGRVDGWAAAREAVLEAIDPAEAVLNGVERPIDAAPAAVHSPAAATVYVKRGPTVPPGGKGGAELRILRVLAQRHPARFTMAQWATLAGMKRTGGTWSTYVSRLRTAGYLQQDSDLFGVTAAGLAAAGTLPPRERGGAETIAVWKSAVGGAGRMLEELTKIHPKAVTRAELAERLGIEVTGGTFGTYLSRLRSNGLIETGGDGRMRAADVLWQ